MTARRFLIAASLALLAACGGDHADQLAFLADGVTTRDDALLRLGRPSGIFDQRRILTWRTMAWDGGAHQVEEPKPWPAVRARESLVLVFDDTGVLRRHRVVPLYPGGN